MTFQAMEENPPKVNKWDGNALKNALDDAVKDVSNRVHINYCFTHSVNRYLFLFDNTMILKSYV